MSDIKARKKRDTSKKHQDILDGAIKVFTEFGFENSSMDRIAEVANVSKRTIYNHFPSKEILFQAIVADFVSLHEDMKPLEYSNTLSIRDQLKTFINAELYFINDPRRRGISKLLTSTFLINPDFGQETYGQYTPHKAFIDWLNLAKADKHLDFEFAELAAEVFYGLIEGCLTWNALLTDGKSLENNELLVDEIISVFINRYKY